jgi:hypothetical protein
MVHCLLKFLKHGGPRILAFGLLAIFFGCSSTTLPLERQPLERHTISATVIYADRDIINLAARGRGYFKAGIVRGFYDSQRNELWCPNDTSQEALATCGHEIRHLIKGSFH